MQLAPSNAKTLKGLSHLDDTGPPPRDEPKFRPRAVLLVLAVLVLVFLSAKYLWSAVSALIIGGSISALFSPIVSRLARVRVPRLATALVLVLVLVGAIVAGFALVIPRAYVEFRDLLTMVPEHADQLERWLRVNGLLGENADPMVSQTISSLGQELQEGLVGSWTWLVGQVTALFGSILVIFLGLFIGLYLLIGGPELARALPAWIPPQHRSVWTDFGSRARAVLSAYVQARLIASLFIGSSYWAAFAALGINQAAFLALTGGMLNLIPVVGPSLALVPAVIVAAFYGFQKVLAVIAVTIVAQQIESGVIGPLVEGRFVRLPPLVVVLSATVGAALLGIPGLLIAVPIAAVTRVALEVFYRTPPSRRTISPRRA